MSKDGNKYYPLTHQQKRVWDFETKNSGTSLYNICGCLIIKEAVDMDVLKKVVNKLVMHNDALRLVYTVRDNNVLQYVSEFRETKFDLCDFENCEDPYSSFYEWLYAEYHKPFKLLDNVLYNFAFAKIEKGVTAFYCKIHHLNTDGWSYFLLDQQSGNLYQRIMSGENPDGSLGFSYVDYIENEKKYLGSELFLKDRKFWNTMFGDKASDIAHNKAEAEPEIYKSATKEYLMNEIIANKISKCCKLMNVSPAIFVLSAVVLYFGMDTGRQNVVIETSTENRIRARFKNSVGFFANVMRIKFKYDENATYFDFIMSIKKQFVDCLNHQKYPIDILDQDIELIGGDKSRAQVFYNFYNNPPSSSFGKNAQPIELFSDLIQEKLQIVVKESENPAGYSVIIRYCVQHYTEQNINLIYSKIYAELLEFMNNPNAKVKTFDVKEG